MNKALTTSLSVPLYKQLEQTIGAISRYLAWINLALIAVIVLQVILRKVFSNGQIALEELQWHLYATAVMFGTAYAQVSNLHVRVDLFYHKFSARTKAIVDLFGITCFALPFVVIVILHSYDFAYESWRVNERSASPSGLDYRWLIKSVIPVSFSVLFFALIAKVLRSINTIKEGANDGSE
ncbi:TRAP transporter small permease subunit [Vibrio scophthalmi]|uniref:TRAP transporter small permease subunit n=1 Tax=Vibrio scophthalmi TaxID=45658 RepID=UPI0022844CEE|nr:TRAP transporter small permease subunit [Vibrio scophthalmi]MCY9803678.1 TRAP transporter small permease subunit [Vibrio scophthalmi]